MQLSNNAAIRQVKVNGIDYGINSECYMSNESGWSTSTYVPAHGEIVIYRELSAPFNTRFKVGDGSTVVGSLAFVEMGEDVDLTGYLKSDYLTVFETSTAGGRLGLKGSTTGGLSIDTTGTTLTSSNGRLTVGTGYSSWNSPYIVIGKDFIPTTDGAYVLKLYNSSESHDVLTSATGAYNIVLGTSAKGGNIVLDSASATLANSGNFISVSSSGAVISGSDGISLGSPDGTIQFSDSQIKVGGTLVNTFASSNSNYEPTTYEYVTKKYVDDAVDKAEEEVENHNTNTSAHQDIRETINTLGSIHVPELIKSHNTDLEAHSDIRTEIVTTRSQVIPAAINSHNTSTDAHTDIRQQRNADMDNLSANIIPGIASAKVQAHNTDETAHSDIREKIAALESDSVPDYWQAELDNGVEAIRKAAETAGRNKSAFLWYTDAHWNNNSQMSPTLLKYLYEHTPINKVIFGGDIVNNEPTAETIDDRTIMAYLWEWRHAIRGLNHHSVIGNHDDGSTTNNIFPENYIYAYLLASEESNDIVYGDGFYYYIDDKCEKTRYLYLDTTYKGRGDKQLTFVKEALLTTPDDWHIVAIAHIWYQPDYEQYDVRPIPIKGLDDYSAKIIALLDSYNAREGDFATCGGKVEFCIGGHTHIDYDGRTPGGIPIILTETDSKHIRSTLTYTEGTITESSVNAVIPIYDDNKIYIIRIGRGESRTVALAKRPAVYTNVLPLAVSLDGGAADLTISDVYAYTGNAGDSTTVDSKLLIDWDVNTNYWPENSTLTKGTNCITATKSSGEKLITSSNNNIAAYDGLKFTVTPNSANQKTTLVVKVNDVQKNFTLGSGTTECVLSFAEIGVTPTSSSTIFFGAEDDGTVLTGEDGSVGFLNNKRWSNSAASYIDLNGWDTSGAIPCKVGDVIRLKNITMYPYSNSSSYGDQGYINFYSSEGSYVNSVSLYNSDGVLPSDFAAEYDESGNIIQFTIPSWPSLVNDMAYFSIACQDINENSIITVNEEIPEDSSSYTNVLLNAVGIADMTSVLTGEDGSVGYLNDMRWSASGASYISATGWDVAGLMPCAIGDVIRLKNMTAYPYSESTNGDRGGIGFYDAAGAWLASANLHNAETGLLGPTFNAKYDEDGNITQFTVPGWDGLATVAYFTISCQDINENSIITVNEPIELEKEPTNVLTTALDTDGVSVYNDIGYKQYARLSASGGYAESTASAQFLTGYIPAVANDVIYFKNVTMPYGNDGTHEAEIYLCDASSPFTVVSKYDAHKLPDTWSVICDENNNITQITVGSDYEGKYLRFNIAALDGTSIITVNEPIE